MENEIMNENVAEVAEEIVPVCKSYSGLKIAGGIGLVGLAGVLIYKFIAKPIYNKHKAAKVEVKTDFEVAENDAEEVSES